MMRLLIFWRRHFLSAETGIVVALIIFFTVWFFSFDGASYVDVLMQDNRGNIYRTTATIAGALLGFSITATSIVLGFSSKEGLTLVRGSAHYPTLWKTFFQTIWRLGALTVTALICLIWDKNSSPVSWLVIPFLLFVGLSIVRVARTIWMLERLIGIIIKPPKDTDTVV